MALLAVVAVEALPFRRLPRWCRQRFAASRLTKALTVLAASVAPLAACRATAATLAADCPPTVATTVLACSAGDITARVSR